MKVFCLGGAGKIAREAVLDLVGIFAKWQGSDRGYGNRHHGHHRSVSESDSKRAGD